MTINQVENSPKELLEQPLTPTHDGTLQFLGPDTVKYISPPRIEVARCRVAPRPPPPSAPVFQHQLVEIVELLKHHQQSVVPPPPPPPSYQSSVYPQMAAPPQPQVVPVPVPMMVPQYHPQMIASPPQMMYMPQQQVMAPGMMTSPVMMAQSAAMQVSPPAPPPVQQGPSPTITLNINQSPQTIGTLGGISGGVTGGGGALICPKCRKGIITRQQNRFRKKMLICLAILCPFTCGLPLLCLCCNYVDACACCGKSYGHRGRKNHKKNVNAVKL